MRTPNINDYIKNIKVETMPQLPANFSFFDHTPEGEVIMLSDGTLRRIVDQPIIKEKPRPFYWWEFKRDWRRFKLRLVWGWRFGAWEYKFPTFDRTVWQWGPFQVIRTDDTFEREKDSFCVMGGAYVPGIEDWSEKSCRRHKIVLPKNAFLKGKSL